MKADNRIQRTPPPLASAQIRCVGGVYLHHAGKSGYGRLEEYLGIRWAPSRFMQNIGDTILRIPGRFLSWYCGLYEYSRPDFVQELSLLPELISRDNVVWHFLYGEKQFLLSAYVPRRKNVRLVATFHHHPQKFPHMVQRTRHYRRLDMAIAVSTVQLELLEGIVGKGKVHFVPHGIDTDYWVPVPESPTGTTHRLVFGGCHMRDWAVLEEVIEYVLKRRSDVEFVLITPERECGRIYRQRSVRWLYRIPDDEYRKQMQSATLLVLPLRFSTAVNTVLEALACGVPVLTTRGGISDYLDASCAIQTNPGDSLGMARAVLELLESPGELARMRESARNKAMEFAWPRIASKLRELFAQLL